MALAPVRLVSAVAEVTWRELGNRFEVEFGDDAAHVLALSARVDAHIVVLPRRLMDMEGVTCARLLKQPTGEPRIVLVVDGPHAPELALAADIDGLLTRPLKPSLVIPALDFVLAGGFAVDPRLMTASFAPTARSSRPRLDTREQQILHRLSQGAAYKEIAAELLLSFHVVRKLAHRLYTKLGVHNRVEAAHRWSADSRSPSPSDSDREDRPPGTGNKCYPA